MIGRALLGLALLAGALGPGRRPVAQGPCASLSVILGRPTDRGATLSVLSAEGGEACVELEGRRLPPTELRPGIPTELDLGGLKADVRCTYRIFVRRSGESDWRVGAQGAFHTARAPGQPFIFTLQGDSHPERQGRMFDPALYERTLSNVAKDAPDFHLLLGDDFSLDRLMEQDSLNVDSVNAVYARQRSFLGLVGAASPLFLVNGNHEQAARSLLDGRSGNPAVLAGRARTTFFPLPAPDSFYSGDGESVEGIGLLRDYAAWTWGDALFVTLDPYWHSPVTVDPPRGVDRKGRDLWQITLGETQYRWLEKVLLESRARWKFVFAHHVNGTGRGGVEEAGLYEWGGRDRRGQERFAEKRPGWARPIHALFVKAGVTAFFQGHDHLYARQELDGVVYQSVPNPADPTYQAFNREAYRSGEIRPNSGHLRVTVSRDQVQVEYVRAFLPGDEGEGRANGQVAHAYTLRTRSEGRR